MINAILSKVAEKLVGKQLLRFLHSGKFGEHQWAFTPGLSARDLVSALLLSWILAICSGKKIGGYLGDISAAFDRVCKEYLLGKLGSAGGERSRLDKRIDDRTGCRQKLRAARDK